MISKFLLLNSKINDKINHWELQALTDNALMLKVKSGDLNKLGLLYERHKNRLFKFFYFMNNDAPLSEDMVQNVFMRMLKYKHTFTGDGPFTTWMFHIARNVNYDEYKKRKRMGYQREISAIENNLPDIDSMDEKMDSSDNISQLKKAMGKLSPEKREILILSKFKELKFKAIGGIIGCSETAAKVRAHRALNDLRTVYLQLEKI